MSVRKITPLKKHLPIISEEKQVCEIQKPPAIPLRSPRRPSNSNFRESGLSASSYATATSSGGDYSSIVGQDSEKLAHISRNVVRNKYIVRRDGWCRCCIALGILSFCIIALVVGVTFGLRNRGKDLKVNENVTTPKITTAFPAGSYSINTYLSNATSNCTSKPDTWRCYPYTTYSQSKLDSAATFDWIISADSQTPPNYLISSTPNYFSIMFTNISLSLKSPGSPDEYLFFETNIQKPTTPATPLTTENIAATCNFSNAILQGYLYTKMAKTYPTSEGNTGSSKIGSGAFSGWPYAVRIQHLAMSGPDIPTCIDASGGSLGNFSVQDQGKECVCTYINTGT